jgi:hypothetical protein
MLRSRTSRRIAYPELVEGASPFLLKNSPGAINISDFCLNRARRREEIALN